MDSIGTSSGSEYAVTFETITESGEQNISRKGSTSTSPTMTGTHSSGTSSMFETITCSEEDTSIEQPRRQHEHAGRYTKTPLG